MRSLHQNLMSELRERNVSMTVAPFFVLFCIVLLTSPKSACAFKWSEHEPADSHVVGAVVQTCSGCRLNQLHDLRDFIKSELASHYPAVEIRYTPSHDPILRFLNKYQQVLREVHMASATVPELREMLLSSGITTDTPAPTFVDMMFDQTSPDCIAWRQTSLCEADGPRERVHDQPCEAPVAAGKSGFCQCVGGMTVNFSCDHDGLICADECSKAVSGAEL